MKELKSYILSHKKGLLIATAALVSVGILAAMICTAVIKSPDDKPEPVPEGRIYDAGVFGEEAVIHDSTEGEIVIDGSAASVSDAPQIVTVAANAAEAKLVSDPDEIWTPDTYTGNHTPVEAVQLEDGSLGVLTIDKIRLSSNVFEGPDQMEAMTKGVAHFPHSSVWDGNVSMSAHNINFDGSDGIFKNLHLLAQGDIIRYDTALGQRSYAVESVLEIDDTDWSMLGYTDDNRLTLITCITGKPEKRLCVQAAEKISP